MLKCLTLSRAKHPSLHGHARLARWLAKRVPYYAFTGDRFFDSDEAPAGIADCRRTAFSTLARRLQDRAPSTVGATAALEPGVSDLQFTSAYRVPFPYREHVERHLPCGSFAGETSGVTVTDLDGHTAYDLTGSYGVNLFG